MRAFTIQRTAVLALFALGHVIGAPLGSTKVQRHLIQQNGKRASIEPYHHNENLPLLASIQARGDGDKGKQPSINVPRSEAPSSDNKFDPKPEDFDPFNNKDSNYPYKAAPKDKPLPLSGKSYTIWDITKRIDEEYMKHIDTIGIANGGKDLVITSASNSDDSPINDKKATLAELLFAFYKHKVKVNPSILTTIRIQEVKEGSTWNVMSDLHKAMNGEPEKLEKPEWDAPTVPPHIAIKGDKASAAWLKEQKHAWKVAQSKSQKNIPTPKPSQPKFEFQLSDKQNPEWYKKIIASKWGASVEKINAKFNKKITHIDANTEEQDKSHLIFYLK